MLKRQIITTYQVAHGSLACVHIRNHNRLEDLLASMFIQWLRDNCFPGASIIDQCLGNGTHDTD